MMASSFGYSEPLVSADILRKKCVRLVRDVNVDSVLPVLVPFLLYTEIDAIKAQTNRSGKTRVLIDCLYRRTGAKSYEAFNAFMKILGGTQPELFTELVGRCPTQSETDFCVEGLSNKLKQVIQATGHSTDSPLDEQIDLDKEHISLQITKIQDDAARFQRTDTEGLYCPSYNESLPHEYQSHICEAEKSGENISAEEILDAGGQLSKSVIFSGRAGVGKSTTLQWLARQWALSEWATGFRILFLIQLRMLTCIDGSMTALDLLTLYGLFRLTTKSTQDVLHSWMNNAKARVLIFIDGLDEILGFSNKFRCAPKITDLYQRAHPIDLCINILRGDLLQGCTVVCTSRPFAGLTCLNTYTSLEIIGLNQNQVKRFVEVKHPQKAREVMSVLHRNPILMSVCGITFYCMAVSTLLSEGVEMLDEYFQTYTRLTAFILVQYVSRRLCNYPFVLEVNSYFHKLALLAYKGVFLSCDNGITRISFNEYDLANAQLSPIELDLIRKTGMLQIKDFNTGQRKSISAEFIHLTMQEMLAVAYFLSRPLASKEILKTVFSGGQFNMALLYLFGLQYDKKSIWIKDVCNAVNSAGTCSENDLNSNISELLKELCTTSGWNSASKLRVCQLVHESHVDGQAKAVVDYVVPGGVLEIHDTPMTAIDMLAIAFVCRYSSRLTQIILQKVNADHMSINIMSTSLIKPHVVSLQSLNVSNNNISAEGMETMVKALQHSQHLITLNVSYNAIGAGCAKAMADALRYISSLQNLYVSHNHIGDDGASALAGCLYTNEKLTTLKLQSNDIGPHGSTALAKALNLNTCLQELDLSENHIRDEGAEALAAALHMNKNLKRLRLQSNDIGPNGATALAEALYTNTCLQKLDVLHNDFGDRESRALALHLWVSDNIKHQSE